MMAACHSPLRAACHGLSHDPAAGRRAQKRFAGMTREMLEAWLDGRPFEEDNYIVREGRLAPQYTLAPPGRLHAAPVYQGGSTNLRVSCDEDQTVVMDLDILKETKHMRAWGVRACLGTEGTGSL